MPSNQGPGQSRRNPYPYDISINGVGYRLGLADKDGGKLISASSPGMSAQPSEFSYGAQNPQIESTMSWADFSGGYGQRTQRQPGDEHRYWWALGVDAAVQGQIMLGPLITPVTPSGDLDTTNGILDFFEIGSALYALNGRYVLKRTADSAAGWATTSKDFTAGKAALNVIIHKQNTAGSTQFAYVAMGDSELMYKYDGTTWTQHATLYALAFCVAGRELYRAHSINQVTKCDENADPWIAGNWTAANSFYVGDNSSAIVSMTTNAAGVLVILKTDGVYILDETGQDAKLYSGLGIIPNNADNGKYHFLDTDDTLHITMSGSHYSIGPDMGLEQTGPERMVENNSDVRGYITAGTGTPVGAYAGIYNPDTGNSYLLRLGAWITDETGTARRIPIWHGSISQQFTSKKITAMRRSTIGAPALHERVFIGWSDGTVAPFILSCTPNPSSCEEYYYLDCTNLPAEKAGFLYTSWNDAKFPVDPKLIRWLGCTMIQQPVWGDLGETVALSPGIHYGARPTDSGGTYGAETNYLSATGGFDIPGGKQELSPNFTQYSPQLSVKLALTNNGLSSNTRITPIVTSVGAGFTLRRPLLFTYEFIVLAEDGLIKRDGSRMRLNARQIRANIQDFVDGASVLAVDAYLPHAYTRSTSLASGLPTKIIGTDYTEVLAWDDVAMGWTAGIRVRAIQGDSWVDNTNDNLKTIGSA